MGVMCSIYYNDNTNDFENEFGSTIDIYKIMPIKDIVNYKSIGGIYYVDSPLSNITYEIEFPIRDRDRSLYYDLDFNAMLDEDGDTIFNIFSIISPSDFKLFKYKKESMVVFGVRGGLVELIYPDPL